MLMLLFVDVVVRRIISSVVSLSETVKSINGMHCIPCSIFIHSVSNNGVVSIHMYGL